MDARQHWEAVYAQKAAHEVSWYQPEPRISLELIRTAVPDLHAAILDVGGGASTLVDGLLRAGYDRVRVLDISAAALEQAQRRLGSLAASVTWLAADILTMALEPSSVDLWHDRAVFHFLTDAGERQRYLAQLSGALRPGGHVIVATFAEEGPPRCSGLEVARYSAASLQAEFDAGFELLRSVREDHVTPRGSHQAFVYGLFRCSPPRTGLAASRSCSGG